MQFKWNGLRDSYLSNENIRNFVAPSISRMATNLTQGFFLFFRVLFAGTVWRTSQRAPQINKKIKVRMKKLLQYVIITKLYNQHEFG